MARYRSCVNAYRARRSRVPLRLVAPNPSVKLIALLVLSAVGLALIAVGVTGHTGWTLIVAGFVALLVALPPIWMIQRSRDRTLR
jgi:membrane protein YdbS with pleckstrin-like domain